MSTPLDRLLSAARSAVQHVRGRYQTEEPDYMDALASALGQYVRGDALDVPWQAHVVERALSSARALVALHDDGEPKDTSLEGRLELACAVVDLAESLLEVDTAAEVVGTTADEPIGLRDAFAAGADWMRERVINRLPGGWDAEEAAAGYVEGLGR